MPSNATRAVVIDSLDKPGHRSGQQILKGVANSQCIVVMGAGISVEAQIPDYRSPDGLLSSIIDILGEKYKGKDIFMNSGGPKQNQLAALNYLMTTLRQHARSVPLTDFHRLITVMLDTGRAVKCITRNFDGLETRDRPDLKSKVIEMHGNNNALSCPAGHLPIGPEDILAYEEDFSKGIEITCPTCLSKARERSEKDARLRNINTVYDLRPAVYLDERLVPDLQDVKSRIELLSLASSCQVLLIVGTSLSTPQAFQLVVELADKVHESEGVVVFINTKDLSKSRIAHFVDYHLQMDAQVCARFMLKVIAQQETFDVRQGKDIWLELAERDLTGTTVEGLPPLSIPVCCQNLGAMCVTLDKFAPTPLRPFEERIRDFVCPDCYPYEEGQLYPHLVRAPRFMYELPEIPKKLVLVLYYLGQFWTLSEHIEGVIVGSWTAEGWACSTKQIRLQNVYEYPDIVINCLYDPKTYEMLVVYVTHGVTAQGLYQIGDNVALGAEEVMSWP
ncbi:hypothetical protein FRC11_008065 [Ceratobasidium sp. 423]|nr:hypothetical protein FRC11_008065 [Ceratobasidium sp. 423]